MNSTMQIIYQDGAANISATFTDDVYPIHKERDMRKKYNKRTSTLAIEGDDEE